jgi:hypothetical protein
MSKKSSADIERNQSLVTDMPELFARLLTLLRVVNHGPSVEQLVREEVQMPSAFSSGLFALMSSSRGQSEWERLDSLESPLRDAEDPPSSSSSSHASGPLPSTAGASSGDATTIAAITNTFSSATASASALSANLSSATASALSSAATAVISGVGEGRFLLPDDITDSAYFGLDEMNSDDEPEEEEGQQEEGAGQRQPQGQPQRQAMSQMMRDQVQDSLANILQSLQPSLQMQGPPNPATSAATIASSRHPPGSAAAPPSSAAAGQDATAAAREELTFHALSLAPHQVELLFVLCTLLSGRRKIDVQRR